jgi:4-amino-4-deoxy-L-arabinose transferase-like glycosyltransferase
LFYVIVLYDILFQWNIVQIKPDSWYYRDIALRLLTDLDYGRDLDRPPLYPHFLFANYFLFGSKSLLYSTVRFFQAILDSLTCVTIALTGKSLYNKNVGLFAGLGSALYPFFVIFTGEIMTETLFLFLFSSFTLFLLYLLDTSQKRYAVLSGMSLGLAILCRPTVVIIPPILIVWFLLWSPGTLFTRVKQVILTIACMVLVIAPWTLRNYLVLDKFIPVSTTGGFRFFMGNSEFAEKEYLQDFDPTNTTWSRAIWEERQQNLEKPESWYYKRGWDYIRKHPQIFLRLTIRKLMLFWNVIPPSGYRWIQGIRHFIIYGSLPLLGITGLFLYNRYNKPKSLLFFFFFICFTIVHMLTVSTFRFRVPLIDPYLIIFTSFLIYTWRTRSNLYAVKN